MRGLQSEFACSYYIAAIWRYGYVDEGTNRDVNQQAFWQNGSAKPYERFLMEQILDT